MIKSAFTKRNGRIRSLSPIKQERENFDSLFLNIHLSITLFRLRPDNQPQRLVVGYITP